MKATLSLEYPGASSDRELRSLDRVLGGMIGASSSGQPWVARIEGSDPKYGLKREFLQAKWDYSQANSKGTRGVRLWFVLSSGHLYEVKRWVSSRRTSRYFCCVTANGELHELTKEEAEEWVSTDLD